MPTVYSLWDIGVQTAAFFRSELGRRSLILKSKEVPMTSEVLDPEREGEDREPEPALPDTAPDDEPGIIAPEPDTLPEEPDLNPPDLGGE